MRIEITVPGSLAEIMGRLNSLGEVTSEVLPLIANQVRDQTVTRIAATGLDPSGAAWAPLAASMLRSKRRGGRIMVESGRLLSSINMDVVGDEARVGTPVHYALYHQTGTSRMPQRRLLGLEGEDLRAVLDTIEQHVTALLNGER